MKKSVKKAKKPVKAKKVKKKTQSVKASPYYAQSKRLGIRLLEAGDAALYCGLYTDAKTLEHVCPPLSAERAKQSFEKAMHLSYEKPWTQRISVVVERTSNKPIGIASIKIVDTDQRIAEVGILLKPNAQSQRYATEASLTLITSAFRRHTIDGIVAKVGANHKTGERLVKTLGYARGADLAATADRSARSTWSMNRETWANSYK